MVSHEKLKYKIKQIAGIFARRILCYAEPKMSVIKGGRLGFIRFGSRTDLVVSSNVNICVKEGDKIKIPFLDQKVGSKIVFKKKNLQ